MSEIDMKMSAIYTAAHDVLPEKAQDFWFYAEEVTGAIEPLTREVALAGNHPIGADLADLSVELFVHLRAMERTFKDSATGLDDIADDFVAVDGEAKAWFEKHQEYAGEPDLPSDATAPEA